MSTTTVPTNPEDRTFPDVIQMLGRELVQLGARWYDLPDRHLITRAIVDAGEDLAPALAALRELPAAAEETR